MVRSMIGNVTRYAAARRNTDPIMSTVLDVAGLAAITYGVWMFLHPLGVIAGGVSLLLLGYLSRPAGAR